MYIYIYRERERERENEREREREGVVEWEGSIPEVRKRHRRENEDLESECV